MSAHPHISDGLGPLQYHTVRKEGRHTVAVYFIYKRGVTRYVGDKGGWSKRETCGAPCRIADLEALFS